MLPDTCQVHRTPDDPHGRIELMPHPDPSFPALHGRPPRGWVNDPNGLARVDGTWHVFFQHHPDAPVHRDIRWGHATSQDLAHWTPAPDALLPRPGGPDESGCWSGCLVDDGGTPTAVYSGVRGGGGGLADVLLATTDRTLTTFEQGTRGVAPLPEDPAVTDVRDPFVFAHDGHRYAVQGAGSNAGGARVLLYRCDDLTAWEPLGTLLDDRDPVAAAVAPADVWECPNLFPLGGRWVLLLSLWRFVDGAHALCGVSALVGDLEPVGDGLRFVAVSGGPVDAGPMFYAPQVLLDGDRVLLWGWAREDERPAADVAAAGWSGVLTFPRELSLREDGTVASRAAPELRALRREPLDAPSGVVRERSFEVLGAEPFDLVLVGPGGSTTVVAVPGPARVLVDGSLVEVFADGVPSTLRAYPDADSHWELRGAERAQVWRLGPAGPAPA